MRIVLLIIDSFGVGAAPDALRYGDEGANTAGNICEVVTSVMWPNLAAWGLGNIGSLLGHPFQGLDAVGDPLAHFGAMRPMSEGKDTTTGHWELSGVVLERPFPVFPAGPPSFPEELISALEASWGVRVLGNKAASGTAIIDELGAAHLHGDGVIVYTSADSVLQVAAHESMVPLPELYSMCETARKIVDRWGIGRVIARPFRGTPGSFERTAGRKDYALVPPCDTLLDYLLKHGVETTGVGKIGDIFGGRGMMHSFPEKGNADCLGKTMEICHKRSGEHLYARGKNEFVFVNLVDTDMIYGHRRDPQGYHDAVRRIDCELPVMEELLNPGDWLVISADHGCDPTFGGSDHTREWVPVLVREKGKRGTCLGLRETLADLANEIAFRLTGDEFGPGKRLF